MACGFAHLFPHPGQGHSADKSSGILDDRRGSSPRPSVHVRSVALHIPSAASEADEFLAGASLAMGRRGHLCGFISLVDLDSRHARKKLQRNLAYTFRSGARHPRAVSLCTASHVLCDLSDDYRHGASVGELDDLARRARVRDPNRHCANSNGRGNAGESFRRTLLPIYRYDRAIPSASEKPFNPGYRFLING